MDASWIFFSGPPAAIRPHHMQYRALANPSGQADTGPAECHPRNGPRSVAACSGSGAGRGPRGPCETQWRPLEPKRQRSTKHALSLYMRSVRCREPLQSAAPGDAGCSARLKGSPTEESVGAARLGFTAGAGGLRVRCVWLHRGETTGPAGGRLWHHPPRLRSGP